jgi:ribosome maturation factor RimP
MGGTFQPIFFARASFFVDLARMTWQAAVERTVSGLGYDLVDLERSAGGLLRVTIDRRPGEVYADGGDAVTVDDCEAVTRQLQYLLEVEQCDYARLEVSSPGLDRPLKTPADYERFAGAPVDLTLKSPFQGRKKYRGTLLARDGGGWRLVLLPPESDAPRARKPARMKAAEPEQVLDFTYDEVREARLVPVLNFKGRATNAAPAEVGGQGQ